jgi:CRP/FNR family transcriptional regulator
LKATPFSATVVDTPLIVLTPRQREELAQIGTRIRLNARKLIYREDAPADAVFHVAEGSVKCYRDLPSGKRALSAFLFTHDLFGLAERGRYLNTAQAITPVTLHRFSVSQLTLLLKHDADLQFQFLAKVTHELRESQRRAVLLNRRDAVGRLAMFIAAMGERSDLRPRHEPEIALPMSRSDIASFLGLSLESVSRAATELKRRGVVEFSGRHQVTILDPRRLATLASDV